MKRMILVGLVAVAVGSYSSVYACDHSRKNVDAQTSASHTKTTRTIVVDATTGCTSDKSRVMTFEFDIPKDTAPHFVRMIEQEKASMESPSPLRTAVTLGRAFVTTLGAVVSSLIEAASGITASLV